MITQEMIENAHEIALEEIIEPDNIDKQDFQSYRKRLNGLLDKLEEEIEN